MHKIIQKPGLSPEIRLFLPDRGLYSLLLMLFLLASPGILRAQEHPALKILMAGLDGAVALDQSPNGELYILEADRNRILKIDTLGNRIAQFGSRGDGLQQFDQPSDIEVTNGMRIYVADPGNQRIQILDRRFNFVGSISSDRGGAHPERPLRATKIAVHKEGFLFAYQANDHAIYRYDPFGRRDPAFQLDLSATIKELSCFEVSSATLWVADPRQSALYRYSLSGQYVNFMEGFESLIAMQVTSEAIWLLTRQALLRCDPGFRQCQPYALEENDFVDFTIFGSQAYLLTSHTLYSLSVH